MRRRKPAAIDNPAEEGGSTAVARAAEELADAAEKLAATAPGKGRRGEGHRKRHLLRKLLALAAVGNIVFLVVTKTRLKEKLSELVFGPPLDDDEPESITLPPAEPAKKTTSHKAKVEAEDAGADPVSGPDGG
jgi:hypothetical protein